MRMTVATAVACLLGVGISTAHDAQAAIKQDTTIPAQGLGSALKQLASERDIQLVYRSEIVGERQTSGAVGELSFDEALTKLLKGTGLTFQYLDDRAVTIVPMGSSSSTQPSGLSTQASSSGVWERFRLAQAEQGSTTPSSTSRVDIDRRLTLEEIIVTAQKREERLQDVPISISVLDGADLDQSTAEGVNDMLAQTPGVVVNKLGTFTFGADDLSVRGVSTAGAGGGTMGYYVDSVPYGMVRFSIVPDSNAYDLDRVEILRGPQGTLYGASSLNGTVRILTKEPDLSQLDAKARASFSSTEEGGDNYRGDVAVNVPILPEKLAVRAVAGYQDWGGWIDNLVSKDINGGTSENLRLKVKAQPTDKFSVGVSGWFSRMDYGAANTANDQNVYPGVLDQFYKEDYDVFALNLGYEFSGLAVTSTTSYIDFQTNRAADSSAEAPGDPAYLSLWQTALFSKVFSEELLFRSTSEGAWRWTAGLFYRDAEDRFLQGDMGTQLALPAPWTWTDASESFAVFGELTRAFMDGKLELTGGLRYFEDDVSMVEHIQADFDFTRPLIETKNSFDALTPRVVLNWRPADNKTFYASYSEGFRSGWMNNPIIEAVAPSIPPVKEDNLTNYEVGMKGSLVQGRIQYDIAAYYIEWEDVQQILTVRIPVGFVGAGVNGQSASGPGIDLATRFRLLDNLQWSASFGWNDLSLDADRISATGRLLLKKGDRLNASPEWNAATAINYQWSFGQTGIDGQFVTNAVYTPIRGVRNLNSPVVLSGPILNVSAGFSVITPGGWTATLYGDNLSGEDDSPQKFRAPWGGDFYSARIRPRTIGVQLEYNFGR